MRNHRSIRNITNTTRLFIAVLLSISAFAQHSGTNSYTQTNLNSDIPGMGDYVDPDLINPWGITTLGGVNGYPLYVSDEGTGFASIIDGSTGGGTGTHFTIGSANGQGPGTPAGDCFFNGYATFATLDGTLQAWTTGSATTIKVNNSAKGAVYTGCTLWQVSRVTPQTLYVANASGRVEAYDQSFNPVTLPAGAFTDPNIPTGFTPYGIYAQPGKGQIWVTFFNGTPGLGQGYLDAFDSNGNLLLSLQHGNWMNQPWGIAQAPANWGAFSGALLVAMTGSGVIAAFNSTTGKIAGVLKDSSGQPIVNSGIRGIAFGNGSFSGGPTTTLFFTAGIDNFTHGLFGSITAN